MVVLRDWRPEFSVFSSARVIDEGGIWRGTDGAASIALVRWVVSVAL